MYRFVVLCFLSSFLATNTCFAVSASGSWYESPAEIPHGSSMPSLSGHQAYSNVECANICAQDPSCLMFKYEGTNNWCETSCMGMPSGDGAVYGVYGVDISVVPVSDGYTLYMPWNISLKYHPDDINNTDAKSLCQSEGGDLALIQDAAMHCLVKSILTSIGASSPFIDGRRNTATDNFISKEGEPLPFTKWKDNDPDGGDDKCVRLSKSNEYDFADSPCSDTKRVLCQK